MEPTERESEEGIGSWFGTVKAKRLVANTMLVISLLYIDIV